MIGLCQMFPALTPAAARRQPATVLRMVHVYKLAHPDPDPDPQPQGGDPDQWPTTP